LSSARSVPTNASNRGIQLTGRALNFLTVAAILLVLAIGMAHYSTVAFAVVGVLLLLSLAYACWHWPQATLITLAIVPLFDRYVVSLFIPSELHILARVFSEGLLATAAVVISGRAIIEGRFVQAIRQPTTAPLVVFGLLAVASGLTNGVPPFHAGLGIAFTIDAIAVFFLAAMVPWRPVHLKVLVGIIVAIATVAAILAIAQVVLSSSILGLASSSGRFGEGDRVGAFFGGNPNILGAMLAIAAPFCFFGAVELPERRQRWVSAAIGFLLVLALLFTFSRGAWFGLAASMLVTALVLRPRVLAVAGLTAVLALGVAGVLPRNILHPGSGDAPPTDILGSTVDRFNIIGEGNDLRVRFIDQGLPILAERPLLGVGPGWYGGAVAQSWGSPIYAELGDQAPQRTVDNFWLHLLVEFGVLGTLAYIAIYVVAAYRPLRAAWRQHGLRLIFLAGALAAMGVLAIDSVTEMILEGNTFSMVAWLLLGTTAAVYWPMVGRDAAPDGEDEAATPQN
jgi:putative inorganic carbon (hco3(-)) transporter